MSYIPGNLLHTNRRSHQSCPCRLHHSDMAGMHIHLCCVRNMIPHSRGDRSMCGYHPHCRGKYHHSGKAGSRKHLRKTCVNNVTFFSFQVKTFGMAWGTLALVAVDFVMAGAAMKTQIVEKRI